MRNCLQYISWGTVLMATSIKVKVHPGLSPNSVIVKYGQSKKLEALKIDQVELVGRKKKCKTPENNL